MKHICIDTGTGAMTSELRTNCPLPFELIGFCVGKLDNLRIDTVFDHLEHCLECASFVARLDEFPVPFLTKLQSLPLTPFRSYLLEPEYAAALERLESLLRKESPRDSISDPTVNPES